MEFITTAIEGATIVRHPLHEDPRGSFRRSYCEQSFREAGLPVGFVQVNHSVTRGAGSLRGLHFQHPPMAEDKFVTCTSGRAFDVAVDLRKASPTFGRWAAVEIDGRTSFLVPQGCAHGFQALEDEVHLVYMVTRAYSPEAESGIRFDDPLIGVEWPLPIGTVSDRDRALPLLDGDFQGIEV